MMRKINVIEPINPPFLQTAVIGWCGFLKQNELMKIFFTSFFQIGLVAINTLLIAKGYVLGIFLASFTISLLWSYNVSKIALSDFKSKLIYSFGAGFGAITGYYLIHIFL